MAEAATGPLRGVILEFLEMFRREAEQSMPPHLQHFVTPVLDTQIQVVEEAKPALIADLFARAKVRERGEAVERMLGVPEE